MPASKPHLSATQQNMLARCPKQYEFRYVHRLKMPPSGAQVQGRAFHAAAQFNYEQKRESHQDLPAAQMTEYFAANLDDALRAEEVALDRAGGQTAATLKQEGVKIVEAHREVIAPRVQPDLIEERITIPLGDAFPYDLQVVMDVVDTDGVVRDNKSLSRKPSADEMAKDIQLSTYALAYRLLRRRPEAGLVFDAVLKHKNGPTAEVIATSRTTVDLKRHLEDIGDAQRQIQAGIFPRRPNGWWCSPRFCGYWSRCMGQPGTIFDLKTGVATEKP